MSIYDFGSEFAQVYEEACVCGEVIRLSTQRDSSPEYYTDVHVECQKCGESVAFNLPVN